MIQMHKEITRLGQQGFFGFLVLFILLGRHISFPSKISKYVFFAFYESAAIRSEMKHLKEKTKEY